MAKPLVSSSKQTKLTQTSAQGTRHSAGELRYSDVQGFITHHSLPKEDIRVGMGISQSTQFRYQKANAILKPAMVDRFKRIQRIHQQALELFEDTGETNRWLSTPKDYLEGKTPLQALATDSGAKQVEEMLYRAEYGMFS